jgi:DUF1009 family protein
MSEQQRIDASDVMRVGLIAGWGRYPIYLAERLKASGKEVHCLGIVNHADEKLKKICDSYEPLSVGRLASAFRYFKNRGVADATLAGKFHKRLLFSPYYFWKLVPDLTTIRIFFPFFVTRRKDNKDDTLLTTIVQAFSERGIRILPGTDFAPELLVKRQKLSRRGPSSAQWQDICFGWNIAKEMGRLDIGQSVCVNSRAVLAVEAIEGTDECIRRAGALCAAGGFTVVKVAKPQQDMRFDVPTFGLLTLQTMVESGAKVLAIESGKTIFIDKQEVIDFADSHNVVVVSITEEDARGEQSPFPEHPRAGAKVD